MNTRIALAGIFATIFVLAGYGIFLAGETDEVEQNGAPLVSVTIPPLTGVASEGKILFDANCATCHGKDAAGKDGYGPPLIHSLYRPSHHGDASFFLAARSGTRSHHWTFGDMPPVAGINDAEIAKIITYVRAVQQANGIN